MPSKNLSANLNIGAKMASSVGRVFGSVKTKIKDQEKTLKELRAAYKQAEKGSGEFAGKLDELGDHIKKAEGKLLRLQKSAKANLSGSFKGIGSTFASDAKRIATGAGAIIAASAAVAGSVYSVTKSFVDWADDIGDSAEALGMSTQALQTWQFAAATVGVGGEKMAAHIAKFNKTVADGADKTQEIFSELGINFDRLSKAPLDKQLLATAEAFKNYKGEGNKAAMATALFGKSGYKLAGILEKGVGGMSEFRKLGEETGAVLDEEAAKAAGDAATSLDKFGITIIGLRNTIAIEFVPALNRMIEKFTKLVRENGPQIQQWASGFAGVIENKVVPKLGEFIAKLPSLITNLSDMSAKVWDVVNSAKDFVGGWDKLGIALVALSFLPTIAAIASFAGSLWSLGAVIVGAGGPVIALVALAGALALILTNRESIADWFEKQFPDQLASLGNKLIEFQKIVEKFADGGLPALISDTAKAQMQRGADRVKSALGIKVDRGMEFRAGDFPPAPNSSGRTPAIEKPQSSNSNIININVTAPGADGTKIARDVRTALNRKPLFDSDGALLPA
jgi:ABC-type transporter Mla subunit MlaD